MSAITGTVKWFNATKGFGFITLIKVAKMYSYTSLLSKQTAATAH